MIQGFNNKSKRILDELCTVAQLKVYNLITRLFFSVFIFQQDSAHCYSSNAFEVFKYCQQAIKYLILASCAHFFGSRVLGRCGHWCNKAPRRFYVGNEALSRNASSVATFSSLFLLSQLIYLYDQNAICVSVSGWVPQIPTAAHSSLHPQTY